MLHKKKLLDLIKGTKPKSWPEPVNPNQITTAEAVEITAWEEAGGQAHTIIKLSIGDQEMIHICRADTALQMWKQLLLVKETHSRIGILVAQRKMYQTYADKGTNIADHITKYGKMQEEIHMMGSLVTDEDFSKLLLSSLPESWDQFTSAYLGSHSDEKVTVKSHEIIAILLEEHRRQSEHGKQDMALQANTYRNQD